MVLNNIELSIIIISYNTKLITEGCIKSIYRSLNSSKLSYEIIVVDNASSDGSQEMLKAYKQNYVNFALAVNHENIGFAKANNQAARVAKGKYILFLNSDIIVLEQAILKLYKFYQQNENVINFLGGKLLNKNNTNQPSCGPFYNLFVVFAALFLRGDYWGLTRYSPNQVKQVDWISGACILTKKRLFNHLIGFDEKIFMYMDEIDLLYRAKKEGLRVFFYPQAKFVHLGSASSGDKTYPIIQVYRGLVYFYKKHHSDQMIFFLKLMLKLKALIAIILGRIFNNQYLINTYGQAYQIAKMA